GRDRPRWKQSLKARCSCAPFVCPVFVCQRKPGQRNGPRTTVREPLDFSRSIGINVPLTLATPARRRQAQMNDVTQAGPFSFPGSAWGARNRCSLPYLARNLRLNLLDNRPPQKGDDTRGGGARVPVPVARSRQSYSQGRNKSCCAWPCCFSSSP